MEIWKDIEGYEGLYLVSNYGNVLWIKYNILLKLYTGPICYRTVRLKKDNLSKSFYVHRLVATAFLPNPENKPQVNHIDGNRVNNDLTNLEWATSKENINHAHATGLCVRKAITIQNIKTVLILRDYEVDYAVIRVMTGLSIKQIFHITEKYTLRYHNDQQLKTAA